MVQKEEKEEVVSKDTDYNKIGVIFGVIGFLVLPLLFGLLAIIFGAIAKGKGSKKNTALILGVINLVWWIIKLFFIGSMFFY